MMNIKFKTLAVPENMKIVPGVAYASNGDYQIQVCKDQDEVTFYLVHEVSAC